MDLIVIKASINSYKFNVGGKYKIEIDTKMDTYRNELAEVLVLFSALNRFLGDVKDKLDNSYDRLKKGKEQIVIDKDEEALYQNPRLVRK